MKRVSAALRVLIAAMLVWAALPLVAAHAQLSGGKRLALVVGNSNYQSVYSLKNAATDSQSVASALNALGFEVTLLNDASLSQMNAAVDTLAKRAEAENAQATLLYYSGHGFQLGGANYLVPIDAALNDRDRMGKETIRLDDIIGRLESMSRQTIILLDACRDNPLPASVRGSDSSKGLAEVRTGRNTYIAFATSPGAVSLDGKGGQGPFARALVSNISMPDMSVTDMMSVVRTSVVAQTKGLQYPWENNTLLAPFYFNPGTGPTDGVGFDLGPVVATADPSDGMFESGVSFGQPTQVDVADVPPPKPTVPSGQTTPAGTTVFAAPSTTKPVDVPMLQPSAPVAGTGTTVKPTAPTPLQPAKPRETLPTIVVADIPPADETRGVGEPAEPVAPVSGDLVPVPAKPTGTDVASVNPSVPILAPLGGGAQTVQGIDISPDEILIPESAPLVVGGFGFSGVVVTQNAVLDANIEDYKVSLLKATVNGAPLPDADFGILVDYPNEKRDPAKADLVRFYVPLAALKDAKSRSADFSKCDPISYNTDFPSFRLHYGAESRLNDCVLDQLGAGDRATWSTVYGEIGIAIAMAAERGEDVALKLNRLVDGDHAIAVATQEQLKRLGCYTGTIDGDWGGGSQSALRRYFDGKSQNDDGVNPTGVLLARLVVEPQPVCQIVADTPPPPSVKPKPSTPSETPKKPAATPKPQVATTKPEPAPPAKPKLTLGGAGIGTFR